MKSWYNIKLPQIVAVEDLDGKIFQHESAFIKPGCYDDPAELISFLNAKLKLCVSDSFNYTDTLASSIEFDAH